GRQAHQDEQRQREDDDRGDHHHHAAGQVATHRVPPGASAVASVASAGASVCVWATSLSAPRSAAGSAVSPSGGRDGWVFARRVWQSAASLRAWTAPTWGWKRVYESRTSRIGVTCSTWAGMQGRKNDKTTRGPCTLFKLPCLPQVRPRENDT